jgi:curved DNA-binding protein CbpA
MMARVNHIATESPDCGPSGAVEPDFSGFDTAEDILRDATKFGLVDQLRKLLGMEKGDSGADKLRIARDIAYEFAGEKNRDLAVDLFIHVTGIAEFGPASLRDYGRRHGCTHEWFRRKAEAMRKRLDLPLLPSQRDEAIRAEHRLVNRRNGAR